MLLLLAILMFDLRYTGLELDVSLGESMQRLQAFARTYVYSRVIGVWQVKNAKRLVSLALW
jgi:hypothetical protein